VAESPRIQRAVISVSDRDGLIDFARGLVSAGVTIYSSGGTRRHLEEARIAVEDIAAYTGFPEIMDGRVKTLHPKIHGGILCRRDHPQDMAALERHGILAFELVVVNLYPFESTTARPDVTWLEAMEQVDIGGPTLLRAAAKNHAFTTVASSPLQYPSILAEIAASGSNTPELRRELARAAFEHSARYDRTIADYFARHVGEETLLPTLTLNLTRQMKLRYGENPHQAGALYAFAGQPRGMAAARQLSGKELSYNNLLDLDSALAAVKGLGERSVVVIKHNNPCGAATHERLDVAARRALDGDALSAFGSVLGLNTVVDAATAEVLVEPGRFIEAIVAPGFDSSAVEFLTTRPTWKASVRLLVVDRWECEHAALECRTIDGGMLIHERDDRPDPQAEWKTVTRSSPDDRQLADLRFGWAVVRQVKSNAIALVKDRTLVGVGAGQMSRVDSVEIAIRKAGECARGSVLASDAFFPFADSIHLAAAAGVSAIVQPGGSRHDREVIAACDEHHLAMIVTGRRHFKH